MERPLNLILSEPDAWNAYITLKSAYEGSGPVLRQQLYLELHKIKVEDYKNTTIFISKFKDILSRIIAIGAKIEEIDIFFFWKSFLRAWCNTGLLIQTTKRKCG